MTVYEMRTYTLHVGKMAEAVQLYTQFGYPALQKGGHDKKLIGYVANFAQEVVKGQIPLSVEGIRQPGSRTVRPQYGPRLPPRPPAVVS